MRRARRVMMIVVAAVVVAWAAYVGVSRWYFTPRATLLADLDEAETRHARLLAAIDGDAPRVRAELASLVARTLGGDLETVDHRLRARLNRIAEHLALEDVVVGTGRAVSRASPARREFSRREIALRDELDFIELDGWISARGTLRQALALADAVEAEPWIKRIDQLRLDPRDNGVIVEVTVRLTTLFLPGRNDGAANLEAPPAIGPARFALLVQRNPFRVPPPEEATTPEAPPPASTPTDERDLWIITGVAEGPGGAEVWLKHLANGATRTIVAGEVFLELTFIEISADRAVFDDGQTRIILRVGQKLSHKKGADT